MKKKFLSLMLAIAMISGILPTISFAAKLDGEITFVDATEYNTVTDFEEDDRICAKLAGTAEGSGLADVYAASYNKGELLSCQWLAGHSVMDGMPMDVTTNTIEIAEGADEVRVFAWDLKNNMKPLLESGVIYKKKAAGGSSADVDNTNGVVGTEVNLAGENVSANVPAGVQLENGAAELTLSLQSLDSSASGVEAGEGQALASFDVHIDGVSEENNVPIIVTVDNFTKEGYNKGNLELYHVEKDGTKPMNEVSSIDELDEHNTYYYNPETGSLTLALASFSEIAVVSDTAQGWNGNVATGFNGGTGTENDPYIIANADQLAYFGKAVGGMLEGEAKTFKGEVVKLAADINLNDAESKNTAKIFHPIGYYYTDDKNADKTTGDYYSTVSAFKGTFDGNGHTISNFYQNTWEIKGDYEGNYYSDAMGLFGYVVGGTVKNLTVDNFSSDGEFTPTGVIAAYAVNSTFENIAITNCNPRVYNTGNGGIVGIGGNSDDPDTYKLTFNNITIDNTNIITALWGSWDVACGGLVGMFRGAGHVYMTNCHVAAQIDVYNDVCGNYQYYWYRYSGMMVGTNKNMITDKDGYTVPETSKFHAENCTVHFGDWNDYYYCELVANSLASYTHDHQFSRLTQISSLDEIKSGDTWTKTGNFLYTDSEGKKTCYHIVNKDGTLTEHNHDDAGTEVVNGETVLKENNQIVYLPFNQLFTGYGWGVKHIPVYNGKDYAFEGITILDREVANSVEKFAKADAAKESYTTGTTVTIGELFKAATIEDAKLSIKGDKVNVFVSPIGEDSTAGATYVANTSDWTQGTLTFTGIGAATVTITDYYFCEPTTITVTVEGTEKFKTINENFRFTHTLETVETGRKIKLSELFETVEGAEIDLENIDVSIEGNATFTENADNWQDGTVNVNGDGVVTVTITDGDTCIPSVATITASAPAAVEKFDKKFTNEKFIYRVGNKNTVLLETLFKTNSIVKDADVKVTYEVIDGVDLSVTHTKNNTNWDAGTLLFNNTGIIKIFITDDFYCTPTELTLEVINATNLTSATGTTTGGNFVLLKDINTTTYVNYWNCTLYGNGFTYSANGAPDTYNSKQGHGVIIANNAVFDNVVFVGDIYDTYGAYTNQEGYNALIDASNSIIQNCYVANCASPVLARGEGCNKIVNTTLYGGTIGNLNIKSGKVIVEDVTTVNYDDGRELVGMGIVIHSDTTNATLTINGTLKQYNFISESKTPSDSYAKMIYDAMFGSNCADYHFGNSPKRYVNSGIISMSASFGAENINGTVPGYVGKPVVLNNVNGYVYTQPNTYGSVDNAYDQNIDPHKATIQGSIEPNFTFDHTVNQQITSEDSNNSCIYNADMDRVVITFEEGGFKDYDPYILAVNKFGKNLEYTVACNGVPVTGDVIKFETGGDYTLTYTYTDESNYGLDENGNIETEQKMYEKILDISVTAVPPTIKAPEFTFYGYSSESTTEASTIRETVTVQSTDGKTYIMPETTGANVTSTTVNGVVVNCPVVYVDFKDNSSDFSWLYPVFLGVKIVDNGVDIVGKESTEKHKNITILTDDKPTGGGGWSSGSGNSGSEGKISSGTYKNLYGWTSGTIGSDKNEDYIYGQFSYQATNGNTYYYCIAFYRPAHKCPNCITPDTLITLADGTQKEVQYLTGSEELLVWNLETGSYDTAPIVFVDSDEESEYEVVNLCFSDGTEVGVIYEHGFFDLDIGEYVYIDAENAKEYIGHRFVKQGDVENNTWESVTLEDVVIEKRITKAYSPVTFEHLCYYTDGILSMPGGIKGLFNIFEVDTQIMEYDSEKMAEDIAKYGLYTYEDFEGVVSELGYYAFNGDILKVAIGKGILTWDDIKYYAERYMPLAEENNK